MRIKNCVLCHRQAFVFSMDKGFNEEGKIIKYRISCGRSDCDATTPYYPTEKRAIEAWNRTFAVNVVSIKCSPFGKRVRKEMVK